jgi:hypothetical protein
MRTDKLTHSSQCSIDGVVSQPAGGLLLEADFLSLFILPLSLHFQTRNIIIEYI